MKKLPSIAPILAFLAGTAIGGELRLPSGERKETSGTVTVKLGFGAVTFPAENPSNPVAGARPGERLACNRGVFSLRYDLTREGTQVRARETAVRVRNETTYFKEKYPRLEDHEEGHRRINEAGAPKIEEKLAAFVFEGSSLRKAEKQLNERFREELSALDALHKEWDATHVFVLPESPAP